jgi:hypothetical protein
MELDRFVVIVDRAVEVFLAEIRHGPVVVSIGVLGIEADRSAVIGDGAVVVALGAVGDAAVVVGLFGVLRSTLIASVYSAIARSKSFSL